MKYAEHPHHGDRHDRCRCDGITAPYCPPPVCEPCHKPMPQDSCREERLCEHRVPLQKANAWPRRPAACPPVHYSGVVCKQPPKPEKPICENVLLQKIIACERRSIPQLCTQVKPDRLPDCACPPYTLLSLTQSGAQPWWSPVEHHCPDQRSYIKVFIPVCLKLCDSEGRTWHTTAVVEAEVSYRPPMGYGEHRSGSLFIVPCLRLTGGERCSESGTFCVQLEICLELYVLRPEPCAMHHHELPEKPLPLYPQPGCCHRGAHDRTEW